MYLTALYCKSIKMSTSNSEDEYEIKKIVSKYEREIETIVSKFSGLQTVIFQLPLKNNSIDYSQQTYPDDFSLQIDGDLEMETIPLQFDKVENHAFSATNLWRNDKMKVHEIMSLKEIDEQNKKLTLSDLYYDELQKETTIQNIDILPGNLFFNEKNVYYRRSEKDNEKTLAIESFGIGVTRIVEMFVYGFVVSNFLEELGQLEEQTDREYNVFKKILNETKKMNLTETNIKFDIVGFYFLHRLWKYVQDSEISFFQKEFNFKNDIEQIRISKNEKDLKIKFIFNSNSFKDNVANLLSVIRVKKKHESNSFKFTDDNKYMLESTPSPFEKNVVDSLHKKTKLSEETSSRMNFENLKNIQQMKSKFWKFVDEYFYVQNNGMCFSNQFLESVQNKRSDIKK